VIEDVALDHLLPVAPDPVERAERAQARDVLPRPVGAVVNRILGPRGALRTVGQRDAARARRERSDVGPAGPDVVRVRVVLIAGGREDGPARDFLIDGGPLALCRVLLLDRLQRPRDRALSTPREE